MRYYQRYEKAQLERRCVMSWSIDDWFANNGDTSLGDGFDDEVVESPEPWDLSESE
jgi:hypothetical protein